jgi:N-terminal phage replisome organiser (Phage_rep_org_N)
VRTWIKHWIHRWHGAEIAYIRRTPQGDSTLVTWLDLLTFAAADHCDGELWIAPGRPHSAETLSAICGRDVIWMREALDLLFRTGLLTWRGDEPRVIAVTHWDSEQEPLPTVNRRKALSAERSRRYRARQTRLPEQSPSEPTEEERQQSLNLLRDFRASKSSR